MLVEAGSNWKLAVITLFQTEEVVRMDVGQLGPTLLEDKCRERDLPHIQPELAVPAERLWPFSRH